MYITKDKLKLISKYRYELLAIVSIVLGTILSIVAGTLNEDWLVFPSTLSTLNADFNDVSGRIFFATLVGAGICLIKSDNKKKTDFLNSINTISYFCITIIALVPTASLSTSTRKERFILIAVHLFVGAVLFLLTPILKLYRIITKWKDHHKKITRSSILVGSIVFFFAFVALQAVIFFQGTEDTLKGPKDIYTGKYLLGTHIASFILECLCIVNQTPPPSLSSTSSTNNNNNNNNTTSTTSSTTFISISELEKPQEEEEEEEFHPQSDRPLKKFKSDNTINNMSSDNNNNNNNSNNTNGINHDSEDNKLQNGTSTFNTEVNDGSGSYFNKKELVRLLIQSLNCLGYKKSSEFLEKDSGISLQSPEVTQFSNSVLEGDWNRVETLLPYLQLNTKDDLDSVKFLIYSQKFLELLENKKVKDALDCLRNDITPLSKDPQRLQTLTSLIMCTDTLDLKKRSFWPGSGILSRTKLLNDIRKYVRSEIMLPENRLEHLIRQSIQYQMSKCLYHNTTKSYISLFEDHVCNRDEMPLEARFTLRDKHRDEVWFIKFSNNGKRLASSSKDNTIIIWDMTTLYDPVPTEPKMLMTLTGHSKEVSYLAWSPDDTMLLSASNDYNVKLWNMDGVCLKTFSKHTDAVTTCAWHPDGKRFVTGGNDRNIYLWMNDLGVHIDGKQLVVICQEKKIRIYDIDNEKVPEISIVESEAITSMEMSNDCKYVLVNTSNQEIHLWDLEKKIIVQKYRGQKQGRFVIRSCFGGVDQAFVLSGSEDSMVYIWHRQNGTLLETLSGHTGTVNSVSWSPCDPYLFCSASDDQTIKVWTRSTCSDPSHEKKYLQIVNALKIVNAQIANVVNIKIPRPENVVVMDVNALTVNVSHITQE
eukprot:gene771-956_t